MGKNASHGRTGPAAATARPAVQFGRSVAWGDTLPPVGVAIGSAAAAEFALEFRLRGSSGGAAVGRPWPQATARGGDEAMAGEESIERAREVADDLRRLGVVTVSRLFGGAGLKLDGVQFALVLGGVLYLRVDDASRGAFEAAGSKPFTYTARGRPVTVASYYEAPAATLDDPDELRLWALRARDARLSAPPAKSRKRGKSRAEPAA